MQLELSCNSLLAGKLPHHHARTVCRLSDLKWAILLENSPTHPAATTETLLNTYATMSNECYSTARYQIIAILLNLPSTLPLRCQVY